MKKSSFIWLMLVIVLFSGRSYAQRSAINEAKTFLKSSNFKKAEESVNKALQNDATKDLAETWDLAGDIYKKWGESENMKAYLKRKYDTLQLYKSTLKMIQAYMMCDEIAERPNKKGKVNNRYRSSNSSAILKERLNLVSGGLYFINLGKDAQTKTALEYLGTYIDTAIHPMMKSYNLIDSDTLIPQVTYFTCIAATRLNNYESIIKYAPYADGNQQYGEPCKQWLAIAYQQKGDTINYISTLIDGFKRYPHGKYFFANIVSYYLNEDNLDEALRIADEELAKKPNDSYNLYVKGYIYEVMKKYDEAIAVFNQSIKADSTNAEAYSNLGLVYCLLAQDYSEKSTSNIKDPNYLEDQETIKGFYKKAMEPYEMARKLQPEQKELWLNGLYRVYYNLNLGDKFKEIENLM